MIFFLVKDLDLILHTWIQHGPWWTCRAWKSPFLGFLLSFSFFFSSFPKHDHMRLIINLWQFLNELLISVQRKVQLQEHQKISCQGSLLSRPYILLQSHSTAFFLEKSWCQTGICSMWDFFFLCLHQPFVSSLQLQNLILGLLTFQSKHSTAEFHGAARAIGGCAVYVR